MGNFTKAIAKRPRASGDSDRKARQPLEETVAASVGAGMAYLDLEGAGRVSKRLADMSDSELFQAFLAGTVTAALTAAMERPLKRSSDKFVSAIHDAHKLVIEEIKRRGLKHEGRLL